MFPVLPDVVGLTNAWAPVYQPAQDGYLHCYRVTVARDSIHKLYTIDQLHDYAKLLRCTLVQIYPCMDDIPLYLVQEGEIVTFRFSIPKQIMAAALIKQLQANIDG